MSKYSNYVVSYDISNQKERSRVSKTLTGYGFRVQKSVFECLLSPRGKARLIAKLDEFNLKTGYIYIYQINKRTKRVGLGSVPPSADDGFAFVV